MIGCHDCGHIYVMPACDVGHEMQCVHCDHVILCKHAEWESKVTALTFTGLILFVFANTLPFLGLEQAGQIQNSNIISGVQALIARDRFILASLVFVTIFLFPLLELLGLSYVLVFRRANVRAPFLGQVLHLLELSRPWSMLEIFLIGVLVSAIKLAGMATVIPGAGLYAFLGLVVVLLACHMYLDRHEIWQWLDDKNFYVNEHTEQVYPCKGCDALIGESVLLVDNECPRCSNEVHPRWPKSIQKTVALLFAATVLYVPSNILPIMKTTNLGQTTSDTIFSGVVHLAESGDLPIALLVFVASIIIPIAKLLVMAYLIWNVSIRFNGKPGQMSKLFRLTELVGRWSMIDVFVVTILVAMVQFGLLANVEPGAALLSFAGVVVLTMMATESFDQKLIWDAYHQQQNRVTAT